MHIFPQLRKLERKYSQELVVVGVHSAKFTSEQETDNVAKAVKRYGIEHPVINDRDFMIWNQYGARAWPSLFFIDPEGNVLGKHEGEITYEAFDNLVSDIVREFEERGTLDRSPLPGGIGAKKEEGAWLSFPEKVLADPVSKKLYVADTGHNRVLVTDTEGRILDVIGEGEEGLRDGSFETARFNRPHGMAASNGALFVADTENHAIRKVDVEGKMVETIAGVGEQARFFHGGGEALSTALNSPWALTQLNGTLYIAMAGFHQLWAMDLEQGRVGPYAGSGRESISDGPLDTAMLAQPTGITTDGNVLYFADSETSSVRVADLDPRGRVTTLVGEGLFEFGDIDGAGPSVRLQHVQCVAYHDGAIYLTDTYNNKIKRLLPETREVTAFLGTGAVGHGDGYDDSVTFHEPGGISAAGGKLYIADTNNHAIRVADIESGEVSTLLIRE